MAQIVRILHPTDFTENSKQAAGYASLLTHQFDAELHILHVIEDAMGKIPELGEGFPPPGAELLINTDEAITLLSDGVGLNSQASRPVHLATRIGPPNEEITTYAENKDVSVIVMGTHGRRGLAHLVVGSVAEAVVRKAGCPVLTVRSTDAAV